MENWEIQKSQMCMNINKENMEKDRIMNFRKTGHFEYMKDREYREIRLKEKRGKIW